MADQPWRDSGAGETERTVVVTVPRRARPVGRLPRPAHRFGRRAFSLMEVLVAIGIVIGLTGSLFAFLTSVVTSRDRVRELTSRQRAAATLIERLERDLMTCLVGDAALGAGVSGDETRITILSRAVPVAGALEGGGFGDLQQAEYRFAEATSAISAWWRDGTSSPRERSTFGDRVFRVRFRYHDGSRWADTFDSLAADRLPAAVEVAIWFDPWPGETWPDEEDVLAAAVGADTPPDRLTFDETPTFDEDAVAEAMRFEFQDEPDPDRLRVIVVPDADAGDDAPLPSDESGESGESGMPADATGGGP